MRGAEEKRQKTYKYTATVFFRTATKQFANLDSHRQLANSLTLISGSWPASTVFAL
jgi:hypothetical protein